MRVRVFGSGSGGNALAFRSGGTLCLVDCGFSCRELDRRMEACGVSADDAVALFFTHDHADHCRGLATFHKKHPGVRLYANGNTADAIATLTGVDDGWCVFETAEPFSVGDVEVSTFSVPHDAADPVGYMFSDGGSTLFVGTDIGHATVPVREALSRATCAVLESNHDGVLLQTSDRPASLKRRIAGRDGHLSNADAADLLRAAQPQALKHLLLAHLSRRCNASYLALEAAQAALKEIGLAPTLAALDQDTPSGLYEF